MLVIYKYTPIIAVLGLIAYVGVVLGQSTLGFPNPQAVYEQYPNSNTGTVLNTLTKLVPSGAPTVAAAQQMSTSDTTGAVGVAVANAGTTGTALVQEKGLANCVFDGATTAGDCVGISATTGGDCHDLGIICSGTSAIQPSLGQVVGIVQTTNGGGGTYQLKLTSDASLGRTIWGAQGGGGPSPTATVTPTVFFAPNGVSANGTPEANFQITAPFAAQVGNLECVDSAAPGTVGGTNSDAFTLRKGGVSQTTTCTISGAATSCADSTHFFSVVAGNVLDIQDFVTSAGGIAARQISCSLELFAY